MDVEDEIFDEFFQKLEDDDEFPDAVLDKLKKVKCNNKVISKDLILKTIEEAVSIENQKH